LKKNTSILGLKVAETTVKSLGGGSATLVWLKGVFGHSQGSNPKTINFLFGLVGVVEPPPFCLKEPPLFFSFYLFLFFVFCFLFFCFFVFFCFCFLFFVFFFFQIYIYIYIYKFLLFLVVYFSYFYFYLGMKTHVCFLRPVTWTSINF
jgi:hypothetical protein